MKIPELQREMVEFTARLESGADLTPEEIVAQLDYFQRRMSALQDDMGGRREQRMLDSKVGQDIKRLEGRTNRINDEAKELEATELQDDARMLRDHARSLMDALREVSRELAQQRQAKMPGIKAQVHALSGEVDKLEENYGELLRRLDGREAEARVEDDLEPQVRYYLTMKRAAEYYMDQGLAENEYLTQRGEYLERASTLLKKLPENPHHLTHYGYPVHLADLYASDVVTLKESIRGHLQDLHHIASEGLKDEDIDGAELPLPYAMRKMWQAGRKEEFYQRLWTLNFLMLHGENVDPDLRASVRSLLTYLRESKGSVNADQERYAGEARRFLLRAGNGVIRDIIAENYNNFGAEADYARFGADLYRSDRPQWLKMLQMAVNIPRLFDLSLNERFGAIYETRYKRRQVRRATSYPRVRVAEDFDYVLDVPPEELTGDWIRRLLDGDLPMVAYEDQMEEEVEVGQEKTIEAQMYLLDVSGSMIMGWDGRGNSRWILRNAIFIAALNTFSVDAAVKGEEEFENLLYARTFGENIGDLWQVGNQTEAMQFLRHFLTMQGMERNTRLHEILMHGYDDIRSAKGRNRALRDAKVVVVTDGQASLDIDELLAAQQIDGTAVVTHVFAVEEQNPQLEYLSQQAGAGKAFYYFIKSADHPKFAGGPPYGTAEEFSPVWKEPTFKKDEDRETFETRVGEMCDDIVEGFRRVRRRKEDQERDRGKELESLLTSTNWAGRRTSYEASGPVVERDTRERKSLRMRDTMSIMESITDDKMTTAEVMGLFRHLADSRAVLPRDFREIFRETGAPSLRKRIAHFRDEIHPNLKEVGTA